MTTQDREKQIAEAEELLGDRLAKVGFVKGLYFGAFANRSLLAYPDLAADRSTSAMAESCGDIARRKSIRWRSIGRR